MKDERVLIDDQYFDTLLADIHAAKKTIQLETYIFGNDKLGNTILTALCEAAKRGVKVQLLIDGIGSRNWPLEMTDKLVKSGGRLKIYHPLPWILSHVKLESHHFTLLLHKLIHLIAYINKRNHQKVCIIDNEITFIGSANIIDHPFHAKRELKWHDITIRFVGSTKELTNAFNFLWEKRRIYIPQHNHSSIRLNYPWRNRRKIYKDLIKKIKEAKDRIWITCPYLIPHAFLLHHLARASKRGIDVRIVQGLHSDIPGLSLLTKTYYMSLLKANIVIMEYPAKKILHEKTWIIDDWVCVGSSNVNYRSFRHDLEVDYCVTSEVAKNFIIEHVRHHHAESKKITLDDLGRLSLWKKLLGYTLLIFKRFC